MAYKAPDVKPEWWDRSRKLTERTREKIDSFGFQWADCKTDGDVGYCELKAVTKDSGEVVYGRYYYDDEKWLLILPPGLFAYSSFDVSEVKGIVKNGKFESIDPEEKNTGELYSKIVAADAVVLGNR